MRRVSYCVFTVCVTVASACGGSSPTSPTSSTTSGSTTTTTPTPKNATGTMTGTVDGAAFTPSLVQIATNGFTFAVTTGGTVGSSLVVIGFGVATNAPGTFAITSGANRAILQTVSSTGVATATWTAEVSQGSGTVTFTTLTTTSASGTFEFTMQPSSVTGPAGTGTKTVKGTFNLTF